LLCATQNVGLMTTQNVVSTKRGDQYGHFEQGLSILQPERGNIAHRWGKRAFGRLEEVEILYRKRKRDTIEIVTSRRRGGKFFGEGGGRKMGPPTAVVASKEGNFIYEKGGNGTTTLFLPRKKNWSRRGKKDPWSSSAFSGKKNPGRPCSRENEGKPQHPRKGKKHPADFEKKEGKGDSWRKGKDERGGFSQLTRTGQALCLRSENDKPLPSEHTTTK